MIAGLEEITAGTIAIDGRIVNEVAAEGSRHRDGFPELRASIRTCRFMTTWRSDWKLRGLPKAEITARVREAPPCSGLEPFLARKPRALSGGQAPAGRRWRAIVRKPKVFLFRRAAVNLDAKMRVSTRTEISKLHARLGVTMIYVTPRPG